MEGQEMKSREYWTIKDTMVYKPNRNKSGFSALPLDRYHGRGSGYQDIRNIELSLFWLSDEDNSINAYYLALFSRNNLIGGGVSDKSNGYNVRLVKD